MVAASNGRVEIAQSLLGAGANPDIRWGTNRSTALMLAAQESNSDVVKVLVHAGADVNARAADGGTALMRAAQEGQLGAVTELLSAKADVNARGANGGTALIAAAAKGHTRVVETLLRANADPNLKAASGETALSEASRYNQRDVVLMLKKSATASPQSVSTDPALDCPAKVNTLNVCKDGQCVAMGDLNFGLEPSTGSLGFRGGGVSTVYVFRSFKESKVSVLPSHLA